MKITITLLAFLIIFNAHSQNIEFTEHLIKKIDFDIIQFEPLDFDGDGDKDILLPKIHNYGNGYEFKWYENINGEFRESYIDNLDFSHLNGYDFGNVVYADIDGNDLVDLYSLNRKAEPPYNQFEIYKFTQVSPLVFQKELFYAGNQDLNYRFEIADLNNDLLADIISFEKETRHDATYEVNIYINNNAAGFISNNLAVEEFANNINIDNSLYTDIYLEDLNSDGFIDIVYLAKALVDPDPLIYDDFIIYYKNNGNGNFVRQQLGGLEGAIYFVEFQEIGPVLSIIDTNNDGLMEIQFPRTLNQSSQPGIFQQVTEDNFTLNHINITGSQAVEKLLYVNSDTGNDIVTVPYYDASFTPYQAYYFIDDGNNTYTREPLFAIEDDLRVSDAKVIDLHQDGIKDYLLSVGAKLVKYTQQFAGYPFEKAQIGEELIGKVKLIKPYNFNGGHDLDLVVTSEFNADMFLYISQGSTNFKSRLIDDSSSRKIGIGITDYNSDGLHDILTIEYRSATLVEFYWYENINNENFNKQFINLITTQDSGIDSIFDFKDLDNDGDLDVIQFDGPRVKWYENSDGNFASAESIISGAANEHYDLNFIDFDNDGDIDVTYSYLDCAFTLCFKSTYWVELTNNGYVRHFIDENESYKTFKPVDINNDGIIDFLVRNTNNEDFIWVGTDKGYQITPFDGFSLLNDLKLADMNNDGLMDIVQQNKIYLNIGNLHFNEINIPFGDTSNKYRLIEDFNFDGLKDIAYHTNYLENELRLLKQINGDPAPIPMINIIGLMIMMFLIMVTFWKFSINQGRGICLTDKFKLKFK